MFERRAVDNAQDQCAIAVEIVFDDHACERGRLSLPISRTLSDVLNGQAQFLEFEPYDGERRMIAKASLRSVTALAPQQRAANLSARLRDIDDFDPHMILGVRSDAAWEDVRKAFRDRSLAYHPDRWSTAELPPEVRDYLEAMARRINAAYRALEVPQMASKVARGQRAEPIFTSGPR